MSFAVWLTGPSGAGKTTLALALEERLEEMGESVEILDGDEVRSTLYPDIGFSKEAREMHNRVVIHIAKLLARNGAIPIVSLISPYNAIRDRARREIGRFVEVYINCPMDVRIDRDPKGLYEKAINGEIEGLTGYDGVYEEPENPEVEVDSDAMTVEEEVEIIVEKARALGYL